MGIELSTQEADDLLHELDEDGDGRIQYAELAHAVKELRSQPQARGQWQGHGQPQGRRPSPTAGHGRQNPEERHGSPQRHGIPQRHGSPRYGRHRGASGGGHASPGRMGSPGSPSGRKRASPVRGGSSSPGRERMYYPTRPAAGEAAELGGRFVSYADRVRQRTGASTLVHTLGALVAERLAERSDPLTIAEINGLFDKLRAAEPSFQAEAMGSTAGAVICAQAEASHRPTVAARERAHATVMGSPGGVGYDAAMLERCRELQRRAEIAADVFRRLGDTENTGWVTLAEFRVGVEEIVRFTLSREQAARLATTLRAAKPNVGGAHKRTGGLDIGPGLETGPELETERVRYGSFVRAMARLPGLILLPETDFGYDHDDVEEGEQGDFEDEYDELDEEDETETDEGRSVSESNAESASASAADLAGQAERVAAVQQAGLLLRRWQLEDESQPDGGADEDDAGFGGRYVGGSEDDVGGVGAGVGSGSDFDRIRDLERSLREKTAMLEAAQEAREADVAAAREAWRRARDYAEELEADVESVGYEDVAPGRRGTSMSWDDARARADDRARTTFAEHARWQQLVDTVAEGHTAVEGSLERLQTSLATMMAQQAELGEGGGTSEVRSGGGGGSVAGRGGGGQEEQTANAASDDDLTRESWATAGPSSALWDLVDGCRRAQAEHAARAAAAEVARGDADANAAAALPSVLNRTVGKLDELITTLAEVQELRQNDAQEGEALVGTAKIVQRTGVELSQVQQRVTGSVRALVSGDQAGAAERFESDEELFFDVRSTETSMM